jgi:hypothetical protein
MGMKRDISQKREERQLRWRGHVVRMEDCRIARQVAEWNQQRKRAAADQSTRGRMGLRTARKEETSKLLV